MGVGEVMSHLYNFGLSQEDERSEARALDLRPTDRVLSIVSAGEMPLSLLSIGVAQVLAVDIDPSQLHLARLKLAAVCTLERSDAIRFLGYRTASPDQRHDWFDAVLDHLPADSQAFWRAHRSEAGPGAIWAGRFEQYLSRITRYAIPLLGRSRVTGICADANGACLSWRWMPLPRCQSGKSTSTHSALTRSPGASVSSRPAVAGRSRRGC
jgi:S-adenosylmethionine:diacylglycerol 3-amino-3-carboxypropyl transferase